MTATILDFPDRQLEIVEQCFGVDKYAVAVAGQQKEKTPEQRRQAISQILDNITKQTAYLVEQLEILKSHLQALELEVK